MKRAPTGNATEVQYVKYSFAYGPIMRPCGKKVRAAHSQGGAESCQQPHAQAQKQILLWSGLQMVTVTAAANTWQPSERP